MKSFKKNRVLWTLILSYLVSGAVLTGLLSLFVSNLVTTQQTEQIYDASETLLNQAYQTSYYALTDIYGDYYTLWNKNPVMTQAFQAKTLQEIDSNAMDKLLGDMIFRDTLVHSVVVINKDADFTYSTLDGTSKATNLSDQGALELLESFEINYATYKDEIFFPRTIMTDGNRVNLISVIYAKRNATNKITSGMIVNLDQTRLSALIHAEAPVSDMMIVSRLGRIISTDPDKIDLFGDNLPDRDQLTSFLNSGNEASRTVESFMGEKSFVTSRRADTLGFVFISSTPYAAMMKEVSKTKWLISSLFVIAILIYLGVGMISTRKIYKPLKDLVQSVKSNPALKPSSAMDEYTYLGAAYDTLIEHNRASQVARLIHGHYDDTSTEVLGLDGEGMTVVAFIIENASPEQLSELSDLIRTTLYWPAAVTSSEAISTILSDTLTGGDAIGDILTGIANLQKQAANVLSLTLAVGIGTRVQTLDQVRVSHRQAMMAAQYALTLGPSQVVPFQEIDDRKAVASQNRDTVASKICDYIDENFTRPELTADEIAEHVGLSVGYMRQIFRQERDTPLNDYLITIRLEHAKHLLISTEATAKEISESVGFNDSRYFYTLFKKRVGMTADEYRKSAEGSEQNHEL